MTEKEAKELKSYFETLLSELNEKVKEAEQKGLSVRFRVTDNPECNAEYVQGRYFISI